MRVFFHCSLLPCNHWYCFFLCRDWMFLLDICEAQIHCLDNYTTHIYYITVKGYKQWLNMFHFLTFHFKFLHETPQKIISLYIFLIHTLKGIQVNNFKDCWWLTNDPRDTLNKTGGRCIFLLGTDQGLSLCWLRGLHSPQVILKQIN